MAEKKVLTRKEKIQEMTILALFIAIIAVMGFIPWVGFIPLFGLSVTIIHIPVLIGAAVLGRKGGVILGLAFGVVSFIRGATSGGFDFVFIFPWVSILPRLIFGLLCYDMIRLFRKIIKNRLVALMVSFLLLSLIHSILVLPMMVSTFPIILNNSGYSSIVGSNADALAFIQGTSTFGSMMKWIWGVLITNSVAEALAAAVIGGIVADRIIAYLKFNNKKIASEV